jgi:hypothetical protein
MLYRRLKFKINPRKGVSLKERAILGKNPLISTGAAESEFSPVRVNGGGCVNAIPARY